MEGTAIIVQVNRDMQQSGEVDETNDSGKSNFLSSVSFSIHPVIFSHGVLQSIWKHQSDMYDDQPGDEIKKSIPIHEVVSNDMPSGWSNMLHLIKNSIRAIVRLELERVQRLDWGEPLQSHHQAQVNELVNLYLSKWRRPASFELISLSHTMSHAIKRGVCAYRISGEIPTPNYPYLCHTCSNARGQRWEICQVSTRWNRQTMKDNDSMMTSLIDIKPFCSRVVLNHVIAMRDMH